MTLHILWGNAATDLLIGLQPLCWEEAQVLWSVAPAEVPANCQHQSPDMWENKSLDIPAPNCQAIRTFKSPQQKLQRSCPHCVLSKSMSIIKLLLFIPFGLEWMLNSNKNSNSAFLCVSCASGQEFLQSTYTQEWIWRAIGYACFLLNCFQIVLQSGCTNLHSLQQWMRAPMASCLTHSCYGQTFPGL